MAPKSPPEWETLFATLRTFRREFPARGWSWDGRFQCMTSSLPGEYAPNAEAIARRTFRDVYNARTLVHAPANIVDLCERTGGLRGNQHCFTLGPIGGVIVFGLWWPWNDQETVSLRVGLLDLEANDEPYDTVRDIFGVSF